MRLTIANISKSIQQTDFQTALQAISRQCKEDFQPEWNISCTIRGTSLDLSGDAPIEGVHHAIIYVGDESQDPNTGVENALGYHSRNHAGIPFGFVYLNIVKEVDEVWTTTLSHEVLELLADPSAVMTVTGPDPRDPDHNVRFDLEVCDPTQGDSYDIDGVTVSNFVTRRYFGQAGGSNATNFLELDLDPFGVRPGGYFQFEAQDGIFQVNGQIVNAHIHERQKARMRMGLARRNTRRADRFVSVDAALRRFDINAEPQKKALQAAANAARRQLRAARVSVTPKDVRDALAE